jgi:hypothetical protein
MKTIILLLTSILLVSCNSNSSSSVQQIDKVGGYLIITKDTVIRIQGVGDYRQIATHVYPIRDTIVHIYKCDTLNTK